MRSRFPGDFQYDVARCEDYVDYRSALWVAPSPVCTGSAP